MQFPRRLSNNCNVYLLVATFHIKAASYHWSKTVVYIMSECTLAGVHGNASTYSILWSLEIFHCAIPPFCVNI